MNHSLNYNAGELVYLYFSFYLIYLSLSPTSDGSAAAILCSEDYVRKHNLERQAVEIVAMEMRTDFPSTFNEKSGMKLVITDCPLTCPFIHPSDSVHQSI